MRPRALFITLEGIDGAGTSTQGELLQRWLADDGQGQGAHLTCEPSGLPVGKLIRKALRRELGGPVDSAVVALLFAADRVDHLRREIQPCLARGEHVISDRYVYSSLAYQSVDLEAGWVAEANRMALEPDLTIYLRVEPEVAHQRRQTRGEAEELFDADETQMKVAATYDRLFGRTEQSGSWALEPDGVGWRLHPDRPARAHAADLGRDPAWAVVDGALTVEEIHLRLRALVGALLRHAAGRKE